MTLFDTGKRGDDAVGDDLSAVRHAHPGSLAVCDRAAAVAHAEAEEDTPAQSARGVHFYAQLGTRPARQDAGTRPRETHHGRAGSQVQLAQERYPRQVWSLVYNLIFVKKNVFENKLNCLKTPLMKINGILL